MGSMARHQRRELSRKLTGITAEQAEIISTEIKQMRPKIERAIRMQTIDDMTIVYFYALHKAFGFGGGRLHRLYDEAADLCGRLKSGELSMQEMNDQIAADTGMNILAVEDGNEKEKR